MDAHDELYPLLDMHGQHVEFVDRTEINRLRMLGVVVGFGTRKKTHGYRLTVSLSRVAGYEYSDRSLVPANYAGTRYVFREKIESATCNSHVYRLKSLLEIEAPEHALLRILTPVALESAHYTPRTKATDEERKSDPSSETKRRVRRIFRLGRVTTKRATAPAPVAPERDTKVIEFPRKPARHTASPVEFPAAA